MAVKAYIHFVQSAFGFDYKVCHSMPWALKQD